jgi:DNA-binding transcriptional LysR family regulator
MASTAKFRSRRITESVCREARFEPRVPFEAHETLAAQALVAARVGVALLPQLALTTLPPA